APTAATNPAVSGAPATIADVRIANLPAALAPGASVQLRSTLVLKDGTEEDCAAVWTIDNGRVASVSSTGLLTGTMAGYANVTASCEGLSRRGEVKVTGPDPYSLIIVAHDSEVPTDAGLEATMEFLEGPRVGQRISIGSVYTAGVTNVEWPVRVRFTAD